MQGTTTVGTTNYPVWGIPAPWPVVYLSGDITTATGVALKLGMQIEYHGDDAGMRVRVFDAHGVPLSDWATATPTGDLST
jgi:hypothetical protein